MADLRHLGPEARNGHLPGESEYRLRRDQPEEGLSHFNSACNQLAKAGFPEMDSGAAGQIPRLRAARSARNDAL
jgi:hypothetical protein